MGLRGEKVKKNFYLGRALLPQVGYTFFFPSLVVKPVKLVSISRKKEISPSPINEKAELSQDYSYQKIKISPEREKEAFLKQFEERKN